MPIRILIDSPERGSLTELTAASRSGAKASSRVVFFPTVRSDNCGALGVCVWGGGVGGRRTQRERVLNYFTTHSTTPFHSPPP
jgi:hypothetical protein